MEESSYWYLSIFDTCDMNYNSISGVVKPLELSLYTKRENYTQNQIPGVISKISKTIVDLEDVRLVIPNTFLLKSPMSLCRSQRILRKYFVN